MAVSAYLVVAQYVMADARNRFEVPATDQVRLVDHPILENTTLIVVSGLDEAYWRDRTREVGAAGFLAKPIASSIVEEIEALAGVPRLS